MTTKPAYSTLLTLSVLALLIPFFLDLGHTDSFRTESPSVQATVLEGAGSPRIVTVSSPDYVTVNSGNANARIQNEEAIVSKTVTRIELNGVPLSNSHIPVYLGVPFSLGAVFDNTSTAFGGPFDVFGAFIELQLAGPVSVQNINFPAGATCQNLFPLFRCNFPSIPAGGIETIEIELVALELTSAPFPQITSQIGSETFNPDPSQTFMIGELWVEPPPGIHLRKFWDYNEDGIDLNEYGLDGIVFELYLGTSLVDSQVSMSMDENLDEVIDPYSETGLVWFNIMTPGDYLIKEILPEGFGTTTAFGTEYGFTVPLPPLQPLIPWGNTVPIDWGDLPDPRVDAVVPCPAPGGAARCYATLSINTGPSHAIIPQPFVLGTLIDAEPDGQPDRLAEGDDINGAPDEDGVEDLVVNPDGSVTMQVRMTDPKGLQRSLDVWIDVNDDGYLDPATENVVVAWPMAPNAVTSVTTPPLGYSQDELIGYYRLRLSTNGGLPPTGPHFEGEVEDYVHYGIDWGDLPDPRVGATCPGGKKCYPTLGASNGPSHLFVRNSFVLGYQIDDEPDGQPSALATGDDASPTSPLVDYNPGADTNDEDGLLSVNIEENGSLTMVVLMTDPQNQQRFLDVWIDLNDDGYLAFAGDGTTLTKEDVFIAEPINPGMNTINTGILTPPLKPDEGLGYMRLRLSSTGGLDPTGHFDDGEVEDYFFPATDWGDAPEELDPDHADIPFGYPTTRSNNGARHLAAQANRIGAEIDGEADGKPTILADGDDKSAKDDEDGVEFDGGFTQLSFALTAGSTEQTPVPGLIPGTTGKVVVFPSRSGKIDAWMDWNADGDWDDAGENIFSGEMVNPPADTLELAVPADATTGFSFTRFRFTINGVNSYDGQAPDGEVEDYIVFTIQQFPLDSSGDGGDSNPGDGICDDGTGVCTLRAAIEEANASNTPTSVQVPSTGKSAVILQPATPLPTITTTIFLDGAGELEIDGSLAGTGANGLVLQAPWSVIQSTHFHSFDGAGIQLDGNNHSITNNRIRNNGGSGIAVLSGTGNSIRTNAIHDNGGLGIDLGADGVTANDLGDGDAGVNNLQNFPDITSATAENGHVEGTLNSTADATFVIDFFASPACDASGNGESKLYVGSARVTTDNLGTATINEFLSVNPILIGDAIAATATDSSGNTSELSGCFFAVTTAIERNPKAELPSRYELYQNYPNPFNPVTNIGFAISNREWVRLEVYDILGKRVATLVDGYIDAGEFTVDFDASDLPSGIYIYRMTAGSFTSAKQLTLLK